jgi:iduronate 2-sulfatase
VPSGHCSSYVACKQHCLADNFRDLMNRLLCSNIFAASIYLLCLAIVGISTSVAQSRPIRQAQDRPNVLFIGVDDLRPELNCYGETYIHSPNIDRLASQGVLFNRAYCQWAVCMPSRASLLTGLRPDTFKGVARGFRSVVPDVVTLPQHFKNNGYFTQSFGKIYHGTWYTAYVGNSHQDPISWSVPRMAPSPQYYYSEKGIQAAREVFATSDDPWSQDVIRDPSDPDQWKKHFVRAWATEAPDVADEIPGDGVITATAIERIRDLASRKEPVPFFLAVGFMKPHLPFIAPKKYWDLYNPEEIPSVPLPEPPEGAPDIALNQWGELRAYSDMPKSGPLTPEQTRHLRHGYAACVSYVDAQVGLLLDELDRLELRKNTIVVLWSDHGFKLGDLGMWCKHTNFELDTRVPLIVSAPGLSAGTKSDALVELVDLYPTLSDLADLPKSPGAEGVSFAQIVKNPNSSGESAAFSQYPRGQNVGYSIRTSRYRYTEWRPKNKVQAPLVAVELYDYQSLGEKRNLALNPAYRKELSSLRSLLRASR